MVQSRLELTLLGEPRRQGLCRVLKDELIWRQQRNGSPGEVWNGLAPSFFCFVKADCGGQEVWQPMRCQMKGCLLSKFSTGFINFIYFWLCWVLFMCFCTGCSEKAMAPHSSTLAWKIPRMEEPGRLQSMGSQETRLSDFTFTFHFHALEKEMATHSSVLAWRIPGTGSLVGCRLWDRTESDTTEVTLKQQQQHWLFSS